MWKFETLYFFTLNIIYDFNLNDVDIYNLKGNIYIYIYIHFINPIYTVKIVSWVKFYLEKFSLYYFKLLVFHVVCFLMFTIDSAFLDVVFI